MLFGRFAVRGDDANGGVLLPCRPRVHHFERPHDHRHQVAGQRLGFGEAHCFHPVNVRRFGDVLSDDFDAQVLEQIHLCSARREAQQAGVVAFLKNY